MPRRFDVKSVVLAAAIVGSSMVYIEGVADNVALPAIQAEFSARLSDLQWIDQIYALCLVALLLVGGSLGDRFGRKRVFGVGIVAFVAASVVAGVTQNTTQLIGARALQGLSAAILVPGSLALITDYYHERDRGPAIGTWWAFATVTLAVGLVLGGWLVQHLSWRAVFFLNIPLGIFALALLTQIPSARPADVPKHADWIGAILATFGLTCIIYALIEQSNRGVGDPLIAAAFVGGVGLLLAFLYVESRVENPIMPLDFFRSRNFSMANLLLLLVNGVLTTTLFLMPLNLIQVQGYSASEASLAILPLILFIFMFSRGAGSLMIRFGPRMVLVFGPLIAALGFGILAREGIGGNYWFTFFPGLALIGVGMAFSLTPLTTIGMSSTEPPHAGVASGLLNASARVGNLLVVTILTAMIALVFVRSLTSSLEHQGVLPEVENAVLAQSNRLAGAVVPADLDEQTRLRIEQEIDDSFVAGFRVAMILCAGILVTASVGAFLCFERPWADHAEAIERVGSSPESAM